MYEIAPLHEYFGVEVRGLDFRNGEILFGDILKKLVASELLVVLRNQRILEREQIKLSAIFGTEPECIEVAHLHTFVESMLSDPERKIFSHVSGLNVKWLRCGAKLIADKVDYVDEHDELIHSEANVVLSSGSSDVEGGAIIKNEDGRAGPRSDVWHSDMSYVSRPPRYVILYAKTIPKNGSGDTLFANMLRAYDSLSQDQKYFLEDVTAAHFTHAYMTRDMRRRNPPTPVPLPEVSHPVIMVHRERQEKYLYVNPYYVRALNGIDENVGDGILQSLYYASTKPDHIYRHQWQRGDLIIWDNLSLMHYGVADYEPVDLRELFRTMACDSIQLGA